MLGRIKMFKQDKGYGFILGEDGNDYFIHISDIITLEEISIGLIVSFEPNENDKGRIAKKVSVAVHKKPTFITFDNIRIKSTNIKNYGINKSARYYVKIFDRNPRNSIFDFKTPIHTWNGLTEEIPESQYNAYVNGMSYDFEHCTRRREKSKSYIGSEESGVRMPKSDLIVKELSYLFVTTYQNDNYIFWENETSFNIYDKCKEIDSYMI